MPHWCCVYECRSSSELNKDLSFHAFPKDKKRRKLWTDQINRKDWKPAKYTTVCSRHFLPSEISPPNLNTPVEFRKTALKKGVYPRFNLRGKPIDERIEKRHSQTSIKAREELKSDSDNEEVPCTSNIENELQEEDETYHDDVIDNSSFLQTEIDHLREKLKRADENVSQLQNLVKDLSSKLFRFENLSNQQILAYTNLERDAFCALASYLMRFNPFNYWSGSSVNSVSHEDQLLICLMKLKFNLPHYDLADRYSVTRVTITNIYMTYLHLIHEVLFKATINKIPSVEKNKSCLPDSFGDFSNCRIIIDCTEFNIENPRTQLNSASLLFSNYKHNLTAKYLIGVAPNGCITYISDGYMGSTSDKMVTDDSGIMAHLKAGDLILADKGFLLHDIIPRGVQLNLPAFLRGKQQFTKEEAMFSRKIARSRIHVERAIDRMRNYLILQKIFSKERWYCDIIVQVCGTLVNLQSPLISGVFSSNDPNVDFMVDK